MGEDRYLHPSSVEEVREIVLAAKARGAQLRVRGSGHSVPDAIQPDHPRAVRLMLDRMRTVRITPEPDGRFAQIEAGAGANLGFDRYDPSGTSRWENGVSYQLQRAGWALDCLGGISHQTLAGFLLTGSAGGSLAYDAGQNVVALELVDGCGNVRVVRRDDPDRSQRELFEAAGVSLGLLGVITRVWLRVGRTYDIQGEELTTTVADARVDLFGERPERPSLEALFRSEEYARLLWWPQPGFDLLQVWTAKRVPPREGRSPRPFGILTARQRVLGALLQTLVASAKDFSDLVPKLRSLHWFDHLERALSGVAPSEVLHRPEEDPFGGPPRGALSPARARRWVPQLERLLIRLAASPRARRWAAWTDREMPRFIAALMGLFVEEGVKSFHDHWLTGLPMDNQLDDQLWPTAFSEIWVPLERSAEVMRCLREILEAGGDTKERYRRVRAFPLEIYPGPPSSFWLSPGYQRAGLRVNPTRFEQWGADADSDLMRLIREALLPFDPRLHWGKHLPAPSDVWTQSYFRQLPRLPDFLRLRAALDPEQIFLTEYWRAQLGIAALPKRS